MLQYVWFVWMSCFALVFILMKNTFPEGCPFNNFQISNSAFAACMIPSVPPLCRLLIMSEWNISRHPQTSTLISCSRCLCSQWLHNHVSVDLKCVLSVFLTVCSKVVHCILSIPQITVAVSFLHPKHFLVVCTITDVVPIQGKNIYSETILSIKCNLTKIKG